MNFFDQIVLLWHSFDPGLALGLFLAYLVVDALYAEYTIRVTQYREYSAATIGALMHFILAFGVLTYVKNFLYVLPLALGSWIGTFFVVRRERIKQKNNY